MDVDHSEELGRPQGHITTISTYWISSQLKSHQGYDNKKLTYKKLDKILLPSARYKKSGVFSCKRTRKMVFSAAVEVTKDELVIIIRG